jgi:hypothetical protein
MDFHHITGTGHSSIIAVLLAMRSYRHIRSTIDNPEFHEIINQEPTGLIDILVSKYKMLIGKGSISSYKPIEVWTRELIPEHIFNNYKLDASSPKSYVFCTDISTGQLLTIDIKKQSYDDAITYIVSSMIKPCFSDFKMKGDRFLCSGTLKIDTGAEKWLSRNVHLINESYIVYNRPSVTDASTWQAPKSNKFMSYMGRWIGLLETEVSCKEEIDAVMRCFTMVKLCKVIHLPESLYRTGATILDLKAAGIKQVVEIKKVDK